MDPQVEHHCFVSWPKSTYDFGVNACTSISSDGVTGYASFEVYDGGFNCASEVVHADILFFHHEKAICLSHFVAIDIGFQGSVMEDEINPKAMTLIKRSLLRLYPWYERVSLFDDELKLSRDDIANGVTCLDRILPRTALANISRQLLPKKPDMSHRLGKIVESVSVRIGEALILRPLYDVIGYDGLCGIRENEDEHQLCSRVRDILDKIKVGGMNTGRNDFCFVKYKL